MNISLYMSALPWHCICHADRSFILGGSGAWWRTERFVSHEVRFMCDQWQWLIHRWYSNSSFQISLLMRDVNQKWSGPDGESWLFCLHLAFSQEISWSTAKWGWGCSPELDAVIIYDSFPAQAWPTLSDGIPLYASSECCCHSDSDEVSRNYLYGTHVSNLANTGANACLN